LGKEKALLHRENGKKKRPDVALVGVGEGNSGSHEK